MPRTATLIPDLPAPEPAALDLPVEAVPARLTPYADDAFAWSREQAALLRAGRLDQLDLENLAEEIAAVGKAERNRLLSALTVLMVHLLKWEHQPQRRSRSWVLTIRTQRRHAARVLAENPSLKPAFPLLLTEAYADARDGAADETGLASRVFPTENPWTFDEVMTRPITLDDETA